MHIMHINVLIMQLILWKNFDHLGMATEIHLDYTRGSKELRIPLCDLMLALSRNLKKIRPSWFTSPLEFV